MSVFVLRSVATGAVSGRCRSEGLQWVDVEPALSFFAWKTVEPPMPPRSAAIPALRSFQPISIPGDAQRLEFEEGGGAGIKLFEGRDAHSGTVGAKSAPAIAWNPRPPPPLPPYGRPPRHRSRRPGPPRTSSGTAQRPPGGQSVAGHRRVTFARRGGLCDLVDVARITMRDLTGLAAPVIARA